MQRVSADSGLKMLKHKGNAIDAAIAVGFSNTVVEAHMGGIAGQGSMLIYSNAENRMVSIDFSAKSPKNSNLDMYKITGISREPRTNLIYEVENNENKEGVKAFTVPGTVAGLCLAHELYGSLPLKYVMGLAISLAKNGFVATWDLTLYIAEKMDWLNSNPVLRDIWIPNGHPPLSEIEKVSQPRLGKLLEHISLDGTEAFYTGSYADSIIKYSKCARAHKSHGGVLTNEDLSEYKAVLDKPISIEYRDFSVSTPSAPTGGPTVLETLNLIESKDLIDLGHNSSEYLHFFTESARHAFADRYSYLGDWNVAHVPLNGMLSKEYAKEIARQINYDKASLEGELTEEPWVYYLTNPIHDPWKYDRNPRPCSSYNKSSFSSNREGGTTHFNVADKSGNFVCCTHYGGWGSGGCITTGNGDFIGGDMFKFIPKAGYVNSIEGWKRPLCNDAPIMVLKDGVPFFCLGAPGSRRIINRVTQIVLNIIDFGFSIQDAHRMPTIDASTSKTLVDSRINPHVINDMVIRGHNVEVLEMSPGTPSHFARPSGIMYDNDSGFLHGGVEVFGNAVALGL